MGCLLCDWNGQLGSGVFFRPTDPRRSVLGPGWSLLFVCLLFFPSGRPPHSVLGHGLGNQAAKLRHGTVGFSCSFFFNRPADALLSSEPGGRLG